MSEQSPRLQVTSMHRKYEVDFGSDAVSVMQGALDPDRTFVVCDARVFELWREYLGPIVEGSAHVLLPPTEESKSMGQAESLMVRMVESGVRRDHTILAIGGGITQDVAAFAASVLYRGLQWAFIPTTLLAQADSCLGSKTSINLGDKKNLVGTFWPPMLAAIDPRFLDTLPESDIRSGIGEMLHFYLYADSALTRPMLEEHAVLLRDRARLLRYVRESLRIKQSVVERDEFDRGERHKFNYGHTFGHALESVTDFAIPHGEAVTVGMDIANFVSNRLGLMPQAVYAELHALLQVNFPQRPPGDLDLDRYCSYLAKDKKNLGRTVGCILAERPGALVPRQLPLDESFRQLLADYFSGSSWRR